MHDYDDEDERELDELFDDAAEATQACVWQLLLLVNPGDEEAALQQFSAYRDALEAADGDAVEPAQLLVQVTDWRSGFQVAGDDPRALVEVMDELSARWNLSIDWGGDVDEEFLAAADVATLLGSAHDRLSEHGYSVWAWETEEGGYAGWITLARDGEPLRELAAGLDLELHPASEFN